MIKSPMSNAVLNELRKKQDEKKKLEQIIPQEEKNLNSEQNIQLQKPEIIKSLKLESTIQQLPENSRESLINPPLNVNIDIKNYFYKFLKEDNKTFSVWVAVSSDLLPLLKENTQVIVEILKGGSKNILTGLGTIKAKNLSMPLGLKNRSPSVEPIGVFNKLKYQKLNIDIEPIMTKCDNKIPYNVLCDPNQRIDKYLCKNISVQVVAEQTADNKYSFDKFKITDCSKNIDTESNALIYINIVPPESVKLELQKLQK